MRIPTLVLASLVLLGACGSDPSAGIAPPAPAPPLMEGWGQASVLGGGGLLTYALELDDDALAALPATASALPGTPEYHVAAALTVSGRHVGQVGLRWAGADGAAPGCVAAGDGCTKPPLVITFDAYQPGQRFEGLRALVLDAVPGDPTSLRQRLAAEVFRRMELIAPRVAHAFVTINGRARGVFSAIEDVGAAFALQRWPNASGGNLYKEAWPLDVNADGYAAALRSGPAAADHGRMAAFAQALFGATPAQLPGVVDRFTHVDQLMRFLAVDRLLNNADGVTAFVCDQTGKDCSNHNYFWYQHPADDRFVLVPWQLGDTFAVRTPMDAVPAWDEMQADCGRRTVVEGTAVLAPGCDLVFQGLRGTGRAAWQDALDRLGEAFDDGALAGLVEAWAKEIEPGVALDPVGPGLAAFHMGVEDLKSTLAALGERLEALRAARPVAPLALAVPGPNSFEDASRLALQLAASVEANPGSGVRVDLNGSQALAGKRDLYFAFELGNDTSELGGDAGGPWAFARLPLADAPRSLSGVRRVRFKIAADNIRTVRVEIDSQAYRRNGDDVIRYGKDFVVSAGSKELVVPLDALGVPADSEVDAALADALAAASALILSPQARTRGEGGRLPTGQTDRGYLRIDDVVFE